MKSLIRSDFYKLRKAKSFWVCMILAVALAVFSVLIMDFSVKLMDKVPQQAAQEEAALEESGLNISTNGIPMSSADLNASSMLLMQFAGTTTILISIFVSLFVGGEFSHGTIKNLASKKLYPHPDLSFQDNRFCHRRNRHDSPLRHCSYRSWNSSLGIWQG